ASSKSGVELPVPIHNESGLGNEGAIVAILDLERLLGQPSRVYESNYDRNTSLPFIVVRDRFGNVVFQSRMPPTNMGGTTASAPMPRLNMTVTVARNTAEFISSARRWGIAGFVLALLLASVAALVLDQFVRKRSRGIARVTEDLSAIAKGELDRRIVLQSSDDARAIADNINVMTAQLRAQIAREEESRQFESFIRLSAMLTHDLKNAIEGLSLTVNNMERHFDNEQFRIDALKGLTNATDKLKAIVARLSRPVSSLSGEHKLPTKTDLIPILNRVIAMTAEPIRGKHTIQIRLPASLFALADAARIEEVMENLILNAIEAMSEKGGTLTIEAGPDPSGAPTFSVSDTGPGMSRTFIETRLFRPFSTTKKNGIGLGLYTCREVIRATGGSIDVQSVEGAGTTFRVVLPSIPHDRRN
ncbi:MAG TPA: ATP-binding protein, partial [Pyrinomonadaceae bacterium]|nr:ATP-binding protein [Pyrinomonadaceae bacterium]